MAQGLLLDCGAATLAVCVKRKGERKGEWKGVAIRPGMVDHHGQLVPTLEGPLRWAVDLRQAEVGIDGSVAPPAD